MKALVVYGSRRGSTRHCAELIGRTLGNQTDLVDLDSRKPVDVQGSDLVIIGSNAFSHRLNPKVCRFVRKNLEGLLSKRVYLFICSGASNPGEVLELYRASYPALLLSQALSRDNFGGCLKTSEESWLVRRILKRMGKSDYNTIQDAQVSDWASSILLAETSDVH